MVPDNGKVPFLVGTTEQGSPTAKDTGQQKEVFLLLRLRVGGEQWKLSFQNLRWLYGILRCQTS